MEHRIVTAYGAPNGGTHVVSPGSQVSLYGMPIPLNVDGVVPLVDFGFGDFCSGALIGDRWVLTAGHCVESSFSLDAVRFDLPGGAQIVPVANAFSHPLYDDSIEGGYDIAMVELAFDAPAGVPRYDFYTNTDELNRMGVKVGYGRSGHGNTGDLLYDGLKRAGLNLYDATSEQADALLGFGLEAGSYLGFDFDNGLPQNDAYGLLGGMNELGFGFDEVNTAPGDSGGPMFIYDGGQWTIAGVTSWGVGLNNPPDVSPGTNSSFGELSFDTRVSTYAGFVQDVLDGVFVPPAVYEYSHGNVDPSLSWYRPEGAGPVQYQTFTFTVDTPGIYDLRSDQNYDGYLHLYEDTFNPADPLTNLLAGNDDAPYIGVSELSNIALTAGTSYTLVSSAYAVGQVGTFLNAIEGPGQVSAIPSDGGFKNAAAPDQWAFSTTHADARVQTDTAPGSITLWGGNDGDGGNTDFTILIPDGGAEISFDWTYYTSDPDIGMDSFGMLVNGVYVMLTNGSTLYGSYSLTLYPGVVFGFRVNTTDGVLGAGIATIYNFQFTTSIDFVLGDTDGDGDVDADDLMNVKDNFGDGGPGSPGDADGDGDADIDDLVAVKNNFGYMPPPGITFVPEPASGALLALGGVVLLKRRRRTAAPTGRPAVRLQGGEFHKKIRASIFVLAAVVASAAWTPESGAAVTFGVFGSATTPASAIVTAQGNSASILPDLSAGSLSGIDVLWVLNISNSSQPSQLIANSIAVSDFVAGGGVFLYHDREVGSAETVLPGGGGFDIVRETSGDTANIDVLYYGTTVTNGPGGLMDDTTLDGGSLSSHGYTISGSLPGESTKILSRSNPDEIVDFRYQFGTGNVYYSTIPLDHYLNGAGTNLNFANVYAPNVAAYAAELAGSGPPTGEGELIRNGDFETGTFSFWTTNVLGGNLGGIFIDTPGTTTPMSSRLTLDTGGLPHGNFYAVTDQPGPGTYALIQPFTVPVDAPLLDFSFDLFANDYSGTGPLGDELDHTGDPAQHARVDILTPGADPFSTAPSDIVATLLAPFVDGGSNPNPFTHYAFDLTGVLMPGQTYRLRFAEVDNESYFNMGVDNVSLIASSEFLLGDTDGDGDVDAEDLANVKDNFGDDGPGSPGDADGDGDADIDDLVAVKNNFGVTLPSPGLTVVPEPGSLGMLVMMGGATLIVRRNRRQSAASRVAW